MSLENGRNTMRLIPYGVINEDGDWHIGISVSYKESPTNIKGVQFNKE